jgi:hypothetical protein
MAPRLRGYFLIFVLGGGHNHSIRKFVEVLFAFLFSFYFDCFPLVYPL